MKRLSIRVQLTLWYFAVLAVTFCLFGVAVVWAMRRSINEAMDGELRGRLQGVQSFLQRQAPDQPVEKLRAELQQYSGLNFGSDLLTVSDEQGSAIYQSAPVGLPRPADLPRPTDQPLFDTVRAGRGPVRMALGAASLGTRRYTIQIGTPILDFYEVLESFEWFLFSAIPAVLILAFVGGYWMSRQALRPVDEIIKSARSISAYNLSQRLTVPETNDELQRLSETLNDMIARLESAFQRITRFTADASHELRTPIALARTTAELSLRKPRTAEEYREALTQILAELERTTNLIEDLMTLARTDAGAAALQIGKMDLVPTVQEVCLRGQTLAEAKQLAFRKRLPVAKMFVHGDAQVLRRLFLILIDNAVKYTPAGGAVAVSLEQQDGFAVGEVADSGIGIAAGDLNHIFERFYRADKARSGDGGGAGLGLSIAQWIAEAHGAAIEVESVPGKGARFRVRIPVST